MKSSVTIQKMEKLRFQIWLQLYQWRKTVLVFVTTSLILLGFFLLLSVTQFDDLPTTKRGIYELRTSGTKKLHSSLMKQRYESVPKAKSTNNPPLRFLINEPYFCLEQKFLYLIVVSSSPQNIEKRIAIRNTWGNSDVLNNTRGGLVFLLGKVHKNMRLQKQIYEESMSYRDVVQADFIDSYKNLTQKSVMALKWFSSYCSHVKFLMKTDDDIFINTETLSNFLKERQSKKRWIVGCIKTHVAYPIKMRKNKAIPILSLPYGHPTFLAGAGYVISSDIVEALYEKSQKLKRISVEDVFITGHCAKAIGVIPEHNPHFSCGEAVRDYCTLRTTMYTGHHISAEKQEEIWNFIHDTRACKTRKNKKFKTF